MRTFSKIYGLAGTRVGYGIAHPDFISALEKIRQPFNINSLAQAGGLAALDDADHVRKTRENNFVGKTFFQNELAALGLETNSNLRQLRAGARRRRPARI